MTGDHAYEVAVRDARADEQKLAGMTSPDEVEAMLYRRIGVRISASSDDRTADDAARPFLGGQEHDQVHLSARVVKAFVGALTAAMPHLQPEDTKGLLLWASGSGDHGPGYLQHLLHQVPDSATEGALGELSKFTTATYAALDARDRKLFTELIKLLPHGHERILRGMLLEVQWHQAEGDTETVKVKIAGARALAQQLLKIHLRDQKFWA